MDPDTHQGGKDKGVTDQLMERVKRIPELVDRQILLIKAIGGYKFMACFKATEVEIREAAEKTISGMYGLQLRLAVAEDILRNTSMTERCIELYKERVKEIAAKMSRSIVKDEGK